MGRGTSGAKVMARVSVLSEKKTGEEHQQWRDFLLESIFAKEFLRMFNQLKEHLL